jgi:hypothetical protein
MHKKENFGKRNLRCGAMDRFKLSESVATMRLSSYGSVFFELFAPFRGYLCLSPFLCVFAALREIFLLLFTEALRRDDQRDHLSPIATIDPKISVGREYNRIGFQLGHPDETSIRQTNWHTAVTLD